MVAVHDGTANININNVINVTKCRDCKYGIGQMEDQIEGEWYSFIICAIEGPIDRETAEDDTLDCDLFVECRDDYDRYDDLTERS